MTDKNWEKVVQYTIWAAIILFTVLLLSGCYTPQKASRQIDKAISRHPQVAAIKTRAAFPCITTSVDSSAYLRWRATLDSILEDNQNEALAKDERINQVEDSLRKLQHETKDTLFSDCSDENESLIQYAARLQADNEQKDKIIKALKKAAASPAPVQTAIKDSAEIFLAMAEAKRQSDTAAKYKVLYEQDHAWRTAKENREAGNLVIYIPWKWIIVIAILLAGWAFIKWRAGGIKKLLKHLKE